MTRAIPFHDSLYRLAQVGEAMGVQLVRIVSLVGGNRYTAVPVEFTAGGGTQQAEEDTVTVTNLAEPADQSGAVPADTEAVAIDVEGRWVIFLRQQQQEEPQPPSTSLFPARIVDSLGQAAYTVREQVCAGAGEFADKSGASDLTAHNLAELSLGPGAAVDDDTIVLVMEIADTSQPPQTRYVFDHPAYAKYLD